MSHQVETMAYANEVPWHGLGQRVDECVTVDEMLIAAGLNWEVGPRQLFTLDADGKHMPVATRKALVRNTDDKVLSIVGNNWKPLQNKEAMEFFREYTEAGNITLETAGSLRGGKVVWGLASLKCAFYVNGKEDQVNGYILLVSPHEPGAAITIKIVTTRVVCANTMAVAMGEKDKAVFRIHHTKEFSVGAAQEMVGLSLERIEKAEIEANALAQLKMSEFDTVRFLAKFFSDAKKPTDDAVKAMLSADNRTKKFNQVIESYKTAPGAVEGTGWGIINGITHWADHVAGKRGDYRLTKAWLGENDRLKTAAYKELLEMAA